MISLEDCVALCGLTEEQVLAIAEHELLPLLGLDPSDLVQTGRPPPGIHSSRPNI
jgi:hypothetical protein